MFVLRGIVFAAGSWHCFIGVCHAEDPGLGGEEGEGEKQEVFHAHQEEKVLDFQCCGRPV